MQWADLFCHGKRAMKVEKPRKWRQCLIAGGMLLGLLCGSAVGQSGSIQLPAKTLLSIQLLQHVPMKVGESVEGRLLYPVYVDNQIAIAAGATLRGTVLQLDSDRSRRIRALPLGRRPAARSIGKTSAAAHRFFADPQKRQ